MGGEGDEIQHGFTTNETRYSTEGVCDPTNSNEIEEPQPVVGGEDTGDVGVSLQLRTFENEQVTGNVTNVRVSNLASGSYIEVFDRTPGEAVRTSGEIRRKPYE